MLSKPRPAWLSDLCGCSVLCDSKLPCHFPFYEIQSSPDYNAKEIAKQGIHRVRHRHAHQSCRDCSHKGCFKKQLDILARDCCHSRLRNCMASQGSSNPEGQNRLKQPLISAAATGPPS